MPRDGEQCAWRSCPIRNLNELDQQRIDGGVAAREREGDLERNSEKVLLIFAGSGAPYSLVRTRTPPKMYVFSLLTGITGKICVFIALHFAENRRKILGNPPFLLSKGAVISKK